MIRSYNLHTCCMSTFDDLFYNLITCKHFHIYKIDISGLRCLDI